MAGVDLGERVAQVGSRVSGGQYLSAGLDPHVAVSACGAHEFLDAPSGLVLDPVADG